MHVHLCLNVKLEFENATIYKKQIECNQFRVEGGGAHKECVLPLIVSFK